MKKKLIVLSGLLMSVPALALAQSGVTNACGLSGTQGTLFNVLCVVGRFLNAVIPVLIALGVLYFVWGVVSYVIASDEEAKKAGRDRMIFGIIGLAVIIGLWGLVNILGRTFGVGSGQNPTDVVLPQVEL